MKITSGVNNTVKETTNQLNDHLIFGVFGRRRRREIFNPKKVKTLKKCVQILKIEDIRSFCRFSKRSECSIWILWIWYCTFICSGDNIQKEKNHELNQEESKHLETLVRKRVQKSVFISSCLVDIFVLFLKSLIHEESNGV